MNIKKELKRELGKIYLEEKDMIAQLDSILSDLSSKYGIDYNSLFQLLKNQQDNLSISASAFNNSLSPLENVVIYLNDLGLKTKEIAHILNRSHSTIYITLGKANHKDNSQKECDIKIPVSLFANRNLSILESLTLYIKEQYGFSYHKIAAILGKDDRTVWTTINRARKKLE